MTRAGAEARRIREHIAVLCSDVAGRPSGSHANRLASEYVARELSGRGLEVERQTFDCLDWRGGRGSATVGDRVLPLAVAPWSMGFRGRAPIVALDDAEALKRIDLRNRIAVLHGALAREPLFPMNFPFLTVPAQQEILRNLTAASPLAVVAVSPHASHLVHLIEDGDFQLPVATIGQGHASALLASRGPVSLCLHGERVPSRGMNVVARFRPEAAERVVLTAHLDTKHGTPGALDNASGVAALLQVTSALGELPSRIGVELAVLNGEDHYAAPGQCTYLERADLRGVRMALNLDGIGLVESPVGVAPIGLPDSLAGRVEAVRQRHANLAPLGPWRQGDHMLFANKSVPVLAITSVRIFDVLDTIVHTSADVPEVVDSALVAETSSFVGDVLETCG